MAQSDHILSWYAARDGQQIGPMSKVQLQQALSTGTVAATDFVWSSELGDWKPASEVFPASQGGPPPPPRLNAGPVTKQIGAESSVTRTIVEGGSFKFGTFIWIVLALLIPLWPVSLPICLIFAYKSYKKPTMQTVRVING